MAAGLKVLNPQFSPVKDQRNVNKFQPQVLLYRSGFGSDLWTVDKDKYMYIYIYIYILYIYKTGILQLYCLFYTGQKICWTNERYYVQQV
jgi:hypothetical protein